jgi:hypothetical protein
MKIRFAGLGKGRGVTTLGLQDFAALMAKLARKNGPHRLSVGVRLIRSPFKHAYDPDLIDRHGWWSWLGVGSPASCCQSDDRAHRWFLGEVVMVGSPGRCHYLFPSLHRWKASLFRAVGTGWQEKGRVGDERDQ